MLDQRKIICMTKLSLFEKGKGKQDLKLAKYEKSDYIRLELLKTVAAVTTALFILTVMFLIYKVEYFLKQAATMQYDKFLLLVLAGYLLVLLISEFVTFFAASSRFRASRKRLGTYDRDLRTLRNYYKEHK